jgi:hypothetical protein
MILSQVFSSFLPCAFLDSHLQPHLDNVHQALAAQPPLSVRLDAFRYHFLDFMGSLFIIRLFQTLDDDPHKNQKGSSSLSNLKALLITFGLGAFGHSIFYRLRH